MDRTRFDLLARRLAVPASRRAGARLLAGLFVGGLLAGRGNPPIRAAQPERPDRDGDGLFDDDETEVYGTNPDVFDTDGDGTGDGEEIYNRDHGLGGPSDPLTPDGGAVGCPAGLTSCRGVCTDVLSDPFNCNLCGVICAADRVCHNGGCLTPGEARCGPNGLVDCGGVCVDTRHAAAHCGACFASCPLGGICQGGVCVGL
jgi:hypothetical protein